MKLSKVYGVEIRHFANPKAYSFGNKDEILAFVTNQGFDMPSASPSLEALEKILSLECFKFVIYDSTEKVLNDLEYLKAHEHYNHREWLVDLLGEIIGSEEEAFEEKNSRRKKMDREQSFEEQALRSMIKKTGLMHSKIADMVGLTQVGFSKKLNKGNYRYDFLSKVAEVCGFEIIFQEIEK